MKTFDKRDTNIIKGVAIIFLMWHHLFLTKYRYNHMYVDYSPVTPHIGHLIAKFLKICVAIFVIVSTMGMTYSIKKKYGTLDISIFDMKDYVKNRFINLFSGWIFVYIICFIVTFLLDNLPIRIYGKSSKGIIYMFIDALGLADLFKTPRLVATWWYMSLAFSIILITPFLIKGYTKVGAIYMCALFVVLSRSLNLVSLKIIHYMPAMIIGIIVADNNIFIKMREIKLVKQNIINKVLKLLYITILYCCLRVRQSSMFYILFEISDGFIPLIVMFFIYEFIGQIKYVSDVLEFIGIYSMNIFLTHTFVRANYCRKFIYGFKYAPLILIILLGISIIISMGIEVLKKYSGYNKLVGCIRNKINVM